MDFVRVLVELPRRQGEAAAKEARILVIDENSAQSVLGVTIRKEEKKKEAKANEEKRGGKGKKAALDKKTERPKEKGRSPRAKRSSKKRAKKNECCVAFT